VTWRVVKQSLLVGKYVRQAQGQEASVTPAMRRRKIAGFDLVSIALSSCLFVVIVLTLDVKDSTLISTASGNKFARNPGDWKWWNSCVPAKLRELDADG
jgi:bifunctional polynucleotide phosphatase/kinase